MKVRPHAESALIALSSRGVPASQILARLNEMPAPRRSKAIEVARLQYAFNSGIGEREGTNGDQVIVIVRDGMVQTAMLRRSWSQAFSPAALRVQEVETWQP